jgi:hypothetical protein
VEYARCFYRASRDDGLSWSKPQEITPALLEFQPRYPWRVCAVGPGHGIQLSSGRLLVPIWLSAGTGAHAHRPSAAATIYSDDDGLSWHAGEIILEDGPVFANPSETALVEERDVMGVCAPIHFPPVTASARMACARSRRASNRISFDRYVSPAVRSPRAACCFQPRQPSTASPSATREPDRALE